MNAVIVRCPNCQERSKVAYESLGLMVACPFCQTQFLAEGAGYTAILPPPVAPPKNPSIPTLNRRAPLEPDEAQTYDNDFTDESTAPPATPGILIALALLPLAIPLVWLAALQFQGRKPEFSFAMPVAIGLGITALCLGLANTRRWSVLQRGVGIVTILGMSVMISSVFFVVKPEWIEQLRAITGRGEVAWVKYSPDPNDLRDNDLTFEVRFPGKPTKLEPPIAGLPIKGARYADPERPFQDEFLVGYGRIAKILPGGAWLADQIWFDKVKTELLQATQAKIISESDRPFQNYSSRLYVLQLPEDANGPRTRILRLVRVGDLQLFLLSIEGSYLNQENVMVKRFLDSLRVMPNRKVK